MDIHVNVSPGQRKGCVGWQRSGSGVVGSGMKSTFNKSQYTSPYGRGKVRSERRPRPGERGRPSAAALVVDAAAQFVTVGSEHQFCLQLPLILIRTSINISWRCLQNVSNVNSTRQCNYDYWVYAAVANSATGDARLG